MWCASSSIHNLLTRNILLTGTASRSCYQKTTTTAFCKEECPTNLVDSSGNSVDWLCETTAPSPAPTAKCLSDNKDCIDTDGSEIRCCDVSKKCWKKNPSYGQCKTEW